MLDTIKFLWLYSFMKKHSSHSKFVNKKYAWGEIFGYKWRLFPTWLGINDDTSDGVKWPAFYTRRELKQWIKDNEKSS